MRGLRFVAVLALCFSFTVLLSAAPNQFGVADKYQVTFDNPVMVGETMLPQGDYQIVHTMEGDTHIMVFTQVHKKNPMEIRVKCSLVPLQERATQTQKVYVMNANNERVLRELIFKGDTAKHVF